MYKLVIRFRKIDQIALYKLQIRLYINRLNMMHCVTVFDFTVVKAVQVKTTAKLFTLFSCFVPF